MSSHYDHFDYPAYWDNRTYEHESEIIAIKALIQRIPKLKFLLEIGAGYGRLVPSYLHRARRIYLTDPSSKLLSIARQNLGKHPHIRFLHTKLEHLPTRTTLRFDLAVMVRVMHHIPDISKALATIDRMLLPHGYLILEIPNKRHFKAIMSEFFKGNFTYLLDIFPKDLRSLGNLKRKTIPFINFHPDMILQQIKTGGYHILEVRSVSNFRLPFFKNALTQETLLYLEKKLQKPLGHIFFGPSIFILAQKKS